MTKRQLWKIEVADGNKIGAMALRDAPIDVIAAYPITPSTQVAEWIGHYIEEGKLDAECLRMDGEDSAGAACAGASLAGARTADITSSQGLLFKAQNLGCWPGSRMPIVLLVSTRTISAPINIHCDHSDVMSQREYGQLMFFAKNPQEVYNLTLLAFKIGEDERVQLPVWVCYDGFDVSHTTAISKVLNEEGLREFQKWLGPYNRPYSILNVANPLVTGGLVLPNAYIEVKYAQEIAIRNAPAVRDEAAAYFSENFWPQASDVEAYMMDDAEYAVVALGSAFGTFKDAINEARARGVKAGALRIVSYRPFPSEKVASILGRTKAVAVLDRSASFGAPCGPLGEDVRAALYNSKSHPAIRGFIYGLGGRTLELSQAKEVLDSLEHPEKWADENQACWVGVRGGDTV